MKYAERCHPGNVRDENQDAILAEPGTGLFMVADGMGGHRFGAEASRMASAICAAEVRAFFAEQNHVAADDETFTRLLAAAFQKAHQEILAFAAEKGTRGDPVGTTATAVWFAGDSAILCHVGDSRAYRFRENRLERLTKDHTIAQEVLDMGRITEQEAEDSPYANILSRALGIACKHAPDTRTATVKPGDIFLLCSDGLTKVVPETWIEHALKENRGATMEALADMLLDRALDQGGPDNVSLVLLENSP